MTWIKVFKKCQYWGEDLPHFIFRLCLELLWEMGEGSVTPRASITIVFNFFFFIGVLLLYNGVLVSAVQQSESAIRIHISPPSWISLPPRSPQSSEQNSLCYTVGSHQLSVLYIVVYVYQSQSPNSSHLPSPRLVSIRLFSTSVSLFLLCKQVHLYHFSRSHIYALISTTKQV